MRKSLPDNMQRMYLCQILQTFLQTIQENHEVFGDLLGRMQQLRQEYLKLLREDLVNGLVQKEGEGAIGGNFAPERLQSLLEKILASFHSDQEKSYQVLEDTIQKKLLEEVAAQALKKGFQELTTVKEELSRTTQQKETLAATQEKLQTTLANLTKECTLLRESHEVLEKKTEKLSKEVTEVKKYQEATAEYQTIIKEIRKEIEEKKELDLWRLKVFYNRVASLTGSNWSCPGVPKPEPWFAKSEYVRKFLENLRSVE